MKELQVLCHLYMPMADYESKEEAIDKLWFMVDSDVSLYIHEAKVEEVEI